MKISKAILSLGSYEFIIEGDINNEEDWNNNVKFISGADENNNAIFSETKPITWSQIQAQLPIVEYDQAITDLRAKRNTLLTETDYIIIKAKETGTTIPTAWKTYRQALRDITENLTTVEEVEVVEFPTKP
jgi:hypothetical protein